MPIMNLKIKCTLYCTLYTVLYTVGSVTLACRSHSSTSPPGLMLTQTHSWAQSCLAHWQSIQTFSAYGLVAKLHNDGQRAANVQKNCWVRVDCSRSSRQHFCFQLFPALFGHSKPFPAIQINVQSFKYISVHVQNFPDTSCHL